MMSLQSFSMIWSLPVKWISQAALDAQGIWQVETSGDCHYKVQLGLG